MQVLWVFAHVFIYPVTVFMNKSMYTIFHQIDLNVVLENFSYVVDNFLFKADGAFQGIPLSGVSKFMIVK